MKSNNALLKKIVGAEGIAPNNRYLRLWAEKEGCTVPDKHLSDNALLNMIADSDKLLSNNLCLRKIVIDNGVEVDNHKSDNWYLQRISELEPKDDKKYVRFAKYSLKSITDSKGQVPPIDPERSWCYLIVVGERYTFTATRTVKDSKGKVINSFVIEDDYWWGYDLVEGDDLGTFLIIEHM